MKKVLFSIALFFVVFSLVACATTTTKDNSTTTKKDDPTTEKQESSTLTDKPTEKDSDSESQTAETTYSTYEEWLEADLDTKHTMVCYVEDKQSWWDNKATVYLSAEDGM